jgi:hypothetical protein
MEKNMDNNLEGTHPEQLKNGKLSSGVQILARILYGNGNHHDERSKAKRTEGPGSSKGDLFKKEQEGNWSEGRPVSQHQYVYGTTLKKWQKKYQDKADKIHQKFALEHGKTLKVYRSDLDQHAENLLRDTEPWIRVKYDKVETILKDGFKSRFETGPFDGHLSQRAAREYMLFEGHNQDLPVDKRPIYGYATSDKDGDAPCVKTYGNVAIRLRKEKDTTVTIGDSLNAAEKSIRIEFENDPELKVIPKPYDKPDHTIFPILRGEEDKFVDYLKKKELKDIGIYAELQFHYKPKVEDIQEVVFLRKPIDQHNGLNLPAAIKEKMDKETVERENKEIEDAISKLKEINKERKAGGKAEVPYRVVDEPPMRTRIAQPDGTSSK